MCPLIQILIDTLIRTSDLALIALGLNLSYGVSRFPNVAHVEMAPLGAAVALAVAALFPGGGLVGAAIAGALAAGLAAMLLHRFAFERLAGAGPASALIGSLAIAMMLRAGLQAVFGTRPQQFDTPLTPPHDLWGAILSDLQIAAIAITAVCLIGFFAMLRLTPLGRSIRAIAANPALATASGIDARRVTLVTVFLGGTLAGIGGILLALVTQLDIGMGQMLLLPVFAAAIVGGLGSLPGAVIGAFAIALAETLVMRIDFGLLAADGPRYLPLGYLTGIGFALIVVTLVYRPEGLLSRGGRRA
ncbi:branched-chain amino acid ABC transporter permease [Azospirillum palustre]|uniref:Branched-chain amino acid ABC transporter permease n=1 Tax=Azospirillum palustre TaxID=2044885 RepID=A0A2B8BFK8_9PROT|nr:branched-chain amino acid ABC transporter permease [Azospirillum palustre]